MPLLALGLLGIFVALGLGLSTIGVITAERQQVNRSLAAVRAMKSSPGLARDAAPPFAERVVQPMFGRFSAFARRFTPRGQVERIRHRLEAAGSPARWDTDRVLAFKTLGLLAGGFLGLVLPSLLGAGPLPLTAFTVGLGLAGYYTPDMVLYQAGYERSQQIQRELPDALDLLTISVEAGLGFDAALSQVARNTTGPLAEEFFRVLQEVQIGLSRADAFRALASRSDVPDLRAFVTSIIQADVFGIPIANVLRVQSREMRVKRMQRAEEKAQKVPVKILFPLIFCILPSLFTVVIGPAAITIVKNFNQ